MKIFSCLLILIHFLFLSSCQKEFELLEFDISVSWKEVSIQSDEIGGKKHKAVTAFDKGTRISNDQIKTIVSQEGVQIVFIMDEDENLRGLTYTKENSAQFEIDNVTATSTLISLFLLTLGKT